MTRWRRRKYFLSKSAQPRLLLGVALLFLILIVIASGLFYILANRELSTEYYKAHSTLKHVMENLLPWLLLVNVLGLIVVLFLSVFYTHRIAGPTYRMKQDLRRIGQGFLATRVKTRKRDQLKDLEFEINEMAEELRRGVQETKEHFRKLQSSLEELERTVGTRDLSRPQLLEFLDKIKSCQEGVNQRLSLFRTM